MRGAWGERRHARAVIRALRQGGLTLSPDADDDEDDGLANALAGMMM